MISYKNSTPVISRSEQGPIVVLAFSCPVDTSRKSDLDARIVKSQEDVNILG
jgi:hypothetical protein